jgi:hypothetical protein
MNLFKKRKRISFVKVVELTKDGWEYRYHTEIDGIFIRNSLSYDMKTAEDFFNKVLENNGATKTKQILKEEYR